MLISIASWLCGTSVKQNKYNYVYIYKYLSFSAAIVSLNFIVINVNLCKNIFTETSSEVNEI
jgi:uncharacterized membrane protein YhdT